MIKGEFHMIEIDFRGNFRNDKIKVIFFISEIE